MGEPSVALATATYNDPRVSTADAKESLARVALAYVGTTAPALELFHKAIMDPVVQPDQKRELIEDLNQDGFVNRKALTPAELEMVANRYAITQEYLQQGFVQQDRTLNAAFLEADKDLRKMIDRAAAAVNPTNPLQAK